MKIKAIVLFFVAALSVSVSKAEYIGMTGDRPGELKCGAFSIRPSTTGRDPGLVRVYSLWLRLEDGVRITRVTPKNDQCILEVEYTRDGEYGFVAVSLDAEPFRKALEQWSGLTATKGERLECKIHQVLCFTNSSIPGGK